MAEEGKSTHFISAPYEIWPCERVSEFLANKYVVIMGDSIQRCAYKDLVTLLQSDNLCSTTEFKRKGVESHQNDEEIAISEEKTNTFGFYQVRSYYHKETNTRVAFYFITKVWSPYSGDHDKWDTFLDRREISSTCFRHQISN